MKLTALEKKVLLAAVADGGEVCLSGLDKHLGANGHWENAAVRLHLKGLGTWQSTSIIANPAFKINDKGREVVR